MRLEGWQDLYWAAMEKAREARFQWGSHDCVLFAAKMATAICDRDYIAETRAAFAWSSEEEALELTKDGLQSLVESVLGPMQPWVALGHGDLILIRDDAEMESMASHDGCQFIGVAARGIRPIPMRCAVGGWQVT